MTVSCPARLMFREMKGGGLGGDLPSGKQGGVRVFLRVLWGCAWFFMSNEFGIMVEIGLGGEL